MQHIFYTLEHYFYSHCYPRINFTLLRINSAFFKMDNSPKISDNEKIYLSIDHLKNGTYQLIILLENKVIKTFTIVK